MPAPLLKNDHAWIMTLAVDPPCVRVFFSPSTSSFSFHLTLAFSSPSCPLMYARTNGVYLPPSLSLFPSRFPSLFLSLHMCMSVYVPCGLLFRDLVLIPLVVIPRNRHFLDTRVYTL